MVNEKKFSYKVFILSSNRYVTSCFRSESDLPPVLYMEYIKYLLRSKSDKYNNYIVVVKMGVNSYESIVSKIPYITIKFSDDMLQHDAVSTLPSGRMKYCIECNYFDKCIIREYYYSCNHMTDAGAAGRLAGMENLL